MSDLRNILKEEYTKKEGVVTPQTLMEMIEEVMNIPLSLIAEEEGATSGGEDFLKFLPKFEMSEKVGELSTPDDKNEAREVFSKYLNVIIAASPTLPGKIEYINSFTTGKIADTASISEILSNLTFLKILSFVVTQFSPAGSGFLFEAFLAALLKGTQITAREQGGALPIDDYREMVDPETGKGGIPVSLKLLSPGTLIEGSVYNLIDFIRRSPLAIDYGGIKYVVAIKTTDNKLEFYKFDIQPKAFFAGAGGWINPGNFKWDVVAQAMAELGYLPQALQEEASKDAENQFGKFKEFWSNISPAWGQAIAPETTALPIDDFYKSGVKFTMGKKKLPDMINVARSPAGIAAWEKVASLAGLSDDHGPAALDQAIEEYNAGNVTHKAVQDLLGKRRLAILQYTEKVSADHPHSIYAIHSFLKGEEALTGKEIKDKDIKSMILKLNEIASTGDLETWGSILIGSPGKRETNRLAHQQFAISQKVLRSGGGTRMGTVITDPDQIRETLLLYSEQLRDKVYPIYKGLGLLTDSINEYYIEGNMLAGAAAADHANELAAYTDELAPAPEGLAMAAKE